MKKTLQKKSILLILLGALVFSFTSCVQEGCTDPNAENYDAKAGDDDGSCVYSRDKFFSSYNVSETCDSGEWQYTLLITPHDDDSKIVLGNLGGWETPASVKATVNGSDISFNDSSNGILFSGIGTLSGNTLTLEYVAAPDGANGDQCVAICVKE